jgi:hypothetical protein
MAASVDVPVCAKPSAGLPRLEAGKAVYREKPARFASWASKLVAAGAAVVGGCCGTTPEHVRAAAEAVKTLRPAGRTAPERREDAVGRCRRRRARNSGWTFKRR